MSNNRFPFCSLIVLNYNGAEIISDNLNALLNLNYPKDRYEILVVDNKSEDNSREIVNKFSKENNIKAFFLDSNLGFSRGNNFGIKKSKGEFVALINNDCIVEKNWLKEILSPALRDKKVFAVNSKVLLYPKFLNIKFQINSKLAPVYTWLSKSDLYSNPNSGLAYLPLWRKSVGTQKAYNCFEVEAPFEPYKDKIIEVTILFNSRGFKFSKETNLQDFISFEDKTVEVSEVKLSGDDLEYQIRVKLDNIGIVKKSLDKVQNAGIMLFQNGYGRDIGAVVRAGQQFHEYDLKQYEKEKEVYAACAAAVLYRKEALRKIGLLDESFFMYYEDVEICERARFAGFKAVYNPKAVVRHYHALSSKEWSPFFIYHVEKGRLLHVFYNFPFKIFLKEYFALVLKSLVSLISIIFKFGTFIYNVRSKKVEDEEPKFVRRIQTIKALSYFIIYVPILIYKRFKYARSRNDKAVSENYLSLLKGDWYFS